MKNSNVADPGSASFCRIRYSYKFFEAGICINLLDPVLDPRYIWYQYLSDPVFVSICRIQIRTFILGSGVSNLFLLFFLFLYIFWFIKVIKKPKFRMHKCKNIFHSKYFKSKDCSLLANYYT